MADVEPDKDPLIPAGIRVQARWRNARRRPSSPSSRRSCAASGPVSRRPGRSCPPNRRTAPPRLAGERALDVGDRVLFTAGSASLLEARVEEVATEIGTTVVTFDPLDREGRSRGGPTQRRTASSLPRRSLDGSRAVLALRANAAAIDKRSDILAVPYSESAVGRDFVVLDAFLDDLSAGREVAVVNWEKTTVALRTASAHAPVSWHVAPGTTTRVSRVTFGKALPAAFVKLRSTPLSVYVVEPLGSARHHAIAKIPSAPRTLRLWPGPAAVPSHLAIGRTRPGGGTAWEVHACVASAVQEVSPRRAGDALLVDLDPAPSGPLGLAPATGNVFPAGTARHVGSGPARQRRRGCVPAAIRRPARPCRGGRRSRRTTALVARGARRRRALGRAADALRLGAGERLHHPPRRRRCRHDRVRRRPPRRASGNRAQQRHGGIPRGRRHRRRGGGRRDRRLARKRSRRTQRSREQVRPRAEPIRRTSGGSAPSRRRAHARSVVSSRARTPRI